MSVSTMLDDAKNSLADLKRKYKLKKANEKLVKTQKTKIAKKIDNYKVRGGLSIWDAISGFAGS